MIGSSSVCGGPFGTPSSYPCKCRASLTCLSLAMASDDMKSPRCSFVTKHITWYWLCPRSSSPSTSAFSTWTSCKTWKATKLELVLGRHYTAAKVVVCTNNELVKHHKSEPELQLTPRALCSNGNLAKANKNMADNVPYRNTTQHSPGVVAVVVVAHVSVSPLRNYWDVSRRVVKVRRALLTFIKSIHPIGMDLLTIRRMGFRDS